MVERCDFLKVVKTPYPKTRFLVTLNLFFSGRGWLFPVSTFKEEYFNEKMSSLDGPKKSCSFFRNSTDFGHFWLTGSTFKVDFLNIRENSKKSSVSSLGEVVRNIVLNFELSIFETVRGDG